MNPAVIFYVLFLENYVTKIYLFISVVSKQSTICLIIMASVFLF